MLFGFQLINHHAKGISRHICQSPFATTGSGLLLFYAFKCQ